jgi:hypothetical protein
MTDPKNADRQESEQVEVARLVSGILDGTYDSIDDAQIALAKSRLSECGPNIISEGAANDDIEPHRPPRVTGG